MTGKTLQLNEKSHCSIKQMPVPLTVSCPQCGKEAEIWSDEEDAVCRSCNHRIVLKKQD